MRAATYSRLRRELTLAQQVPYTALVAPGVVKTRYGDYLQTLRCAGAAFDSADAETLNAYHERLNILWRNIASPQVALWTHLVRRRETAYPAGSFPPGFADELNARYRARLAGETLRVNELYVSLLYRPASSAAQAAGLRLLRRSGREAAANADRDALDACGKLRDVLVQSLQRYDPESLALAADTRHSDLLEFLGTLINGEPQPVALPRAPLEHVLGTSRLLFGREAIEYRSAATTRFGAMLGIKEYPTPTAPGMLNGLLSAPYPLVLTQSFSFLTRAAGQGLLQRQYHRMSNAGDFAVSQAEELKVALDQLSANHFAFGEHHLTLQVLTEPLRVADAMQLNHELRRLDDQVAHARSVLADAGCVVAREDLALEAAFWAQLPGNLPLRPRKAPITTRNFSALAPLHNFHTGRASGNHWGEALALLKTAAGSPYYFSLHASDPNEADGGARRDTGHTFLCGPTGSGKTVFIGFLITQLLKFGASQVVFDKDRGLEILVRALGGRYQPLRTGEPTGCNPLQLFPTPANRAFLLGWLVALAGSAPLTVREQADLSQALAGTLALERQARRLSRLIEYLDPTAGDGLHSRLAPWCEVTGGERAWAFDNPADSVAPQFGATALLGFDVTEFLDNAAVRTPMTLYLFHLIRQSLDGRPFVCWLDEFWRLLSDAAFAQFAKDGPKTWRKLNAVMCLSTQSPSDVLGSELSRTIVEQTPTKIFFPNPDAPASDYQDGLSLSRRETQLIREEIEPGSRRFLVRQGRHSVVCELDLKGFDADLAVLSGRASAVAVANRLIAECGEDPAHWLPWFVAEMTGAVRPPETNTRYPGESR